MEKLVTVLLFVVGLTQVAPVVGVLGADRLTMLYGLSFEDPSLEILMRHRAVLFGVLGGFLLYAAFRPALQRAAFLVGAISILSFLLLAVVVGGGNEAIRKLAVLDVGALGLLAAAAAVSLRIRRNA